MRTVANGTTRTLETRLREEARQTPAGQLLARMGMDYWDTESCARRVAEHAAGEIQTLADERAELIAALKLVVNNANREVIQADPRRRTEATNTITHVRELLARLTP